MNMPTKVHLVSTLIHLFYIYCLFKIINGCLVSGFSGNNTTWFRYPLMKLVWTWTYVKWRTYITWPDLWTLPTAVTIYCHVSSGWLAVWCEWRTELTARCSSSVWNGSVCRQELIYVTQLYWFYVWTINFELPEFHLLLITIYSHNLLGKILPTAPICLHKIYGSTLGNSVSWVARRCSNGFIICNLEIVGTPAHHTTTSQSTLNIPLKIGKQLMTNCIITC